MSICKGSHIHSTLRLSNLEVKALFLQKGAQLAVRGIIRPLREHLLVNRNVPGGDMAGSTPCLRTKSRHTLVVALSKVRIEAFCTFGAEARCGSGHVAKNAHF